jgi:dCMP deaminase
MKGGLKLAGIIAQSSNDPSTKVGALLVKELCIISTGYNRFPDGVRETEERLLHRPTKYALVVHAEANAILSAGKEARGATLFCTLQPCAECAKLIIQAGIRKVVCAAPTEEQLGRWGDSFNYAEMMFAEAGVEVIHE